MEPKDELIAQFRKNSAELVRIHLRRSLLGRFVDLRVWASERPGGGGDEQPTARGFTLHVELLPELRKAVDKALVRIQIGERPDPGP